MLFHFLFFHCIPSFREKQNPNQTTIFSVVTASLQVGGVSRASPSSPRVMVGQAGEEGQSSPRSPGCTSTRLPVLPPALPQVISQSGQCGHLIAPGLWVSFPTSHPAAPAPFCMKWLWPQSLQVRMCHASCLSLNQEQSPVVFALLSLILKPLM